MLLAEATIILDFQKLKTFFKMEKITKEMKIDEVIKKYPQTAEVFAKHGFHCIGCVAASFESIERGAAAHGIDIDELIKDLNKAVAK